VLKPIGGVYYVATRADADDAEDVM